MQKSNSLVKTLAFLFLVLLLAGLSVRYWASEKAYDFTGPTHITADDEDVYLFVSGDIIHLSHSGELISVASPEHTGLRDSPIDLGTTPDGALLIAEQRPAVIRFCDVDSWDCRSSGSMEISHIERQFKVLQGSEPDQWFITDARGDTLWGRNGAAGEWLKLVPGRTLSGPNDLASGDAGSLWVADTDHRRIVELLRSDDGTFSVGREHSAVNELTIGKRYYPMMLARATDGRWWVAQAAEFSESHSDLVIYDPDAGVQDVVKLPDGAYATDLVALENFVLVTDLERFTVYQVDSESLQITEFGDGAFRQHLAELRAQRNLYNRLGDWSLLAIVLGAVLMITAAIKATPKEQRFTAPPAQFDFAGAPESAPPTKGIHWLEREPKVVRMMKRLEIVFFALFVLAVICSLILYVLFRIQAGTAGSAEMEAEVNELGMVLLLGGIALAFMFPVIRSSVKTVKRSLGTDGERVYLRLGDGRELAADPSQLVFNDRVVIFRQHTMLLRAGQRKPLYVSGEVEKWLAPLLHQASKLTEFQVLKHQWKNRDSLLLWVLAAIAVMALLVVLLKFLLH